MLILNYRIAPVDSSDKLVIDLLSAECAITVIQDFVALLPRKKLATIWESLFWKLCSVVVNNADPVVLSVTYYYSVRQPKSTDSKIYWDTSKILLFLKAARHYLKFVMML